MSLAASVLQPRGVRRSVFSAFCAVLIGIGLARFAYTPLVPALIIEGWFSPAEAGYLGAVNFVGYLAGGGAAHRLATYIGATLALRLMMLFATVSFFTCALPVSFLWFFIWRFISGLAGGVLMVLAASAVLPLVAPEKRGSTGGLIFTSVGIGIMAAGTVVPLMLRLGLQETWLALGVVALIGTLAAWGGWPASRKQAFVQHQVRPAGMIADSSGLTPVLIAYALIALGLIPHMVFLVDYVVRGLNSGIGAGNLYWVLFGFGALFGPICAGWIGDHIGFRSALTAVLAIETLAIGLPAISGHPIPLAVSSLLVGAFVPGVVPLVLGRLHELFKLDDARRKAWGRATTAFAAGQAGGGFLFSFIFSQTNGSYPLLFGLGAVIFAIAVVIVMTSTPRSFVPADEASPS